MDQQSIAAGLRELGLKNGDKVLLHSSFISLGKVDGGPDAVIEAFLEVLGKEGTLLVPVFGSLGILTDVLKNRHGAVISSCPFGALAALGADAENICKDHWKADTVHGKDTPFWRLAESGGYVCMMGCDQDRNTTLHGVEALLELPYLKSVSAEITTSSGEKIEKSWNCFPGPHRDFIGLDRYFRESGVMRISRIGNSQVRLIKSQDLFDIGLALGQEDPAFALCDNPACADCVKQRAAIFSNRISKESFKLTVSSRLAGRYLPEMIENLCSTGISFIELDYLQGKACALLDENVLKKTVCELNANGISVSALSVYAVPDDVENLISKLSMSGISRIILPSGALEAGGKITSSGGEVFFRNINHTAKYAAVNINRFLQNSPCRACFNPSGFVMAGEHPFLYSYKAGRYIKIAGQLDLNDALWDGTPAVLARGNGEIKELISILRCSNFSGFFSLGGGSCYPGTLKEAVSVFVDLLDNM